MCSRNFFASLMMACLLAVAFLEIAPVANATPAGPSLLKHGKSATHGVIEIKHRGHRPRLYLPIAPSYRAYDYPYYYSRGFYPTHIGFGYVYYGYPYAYYRATYRDRCSYRYRKCVAKLRHSRRRGSLRRQLRACRCR